MDKTTPHARILVIHDDPETLLMVEQVLAGSYECEFAGDDASARRDLAAGEFDVVLCDVQMPGESGLALVEDLLAERPDVAVIPIAGTEDPTLVERALELGVFGYLMKPFLPGHLLITIQTALRRRDLEAAEKTSLRNREEQLRVAIDQAPVPIFVKDLERRYTLANQFAHQVLMLGPGEMIGRTDSELLTSEGERSVQEGDLQVLDDEIPSYGEVTVALAGQQRTFLTVRFPYRDVKGDLAGIIGVSAELTTLR